MGNTQAKTEEISEEKKIKRAHKKWRKIKLYTSLIAKLKMGSQNDSNEKKNPLRNLQEHQTTWRENLVIDPKSGWKRHYNLFISICIMVDLFHCAYSFFCTGSFILAGVATGIFFIDMIVNSFQKKENETEPYITIFDTSLRYLRTNFIFDLIATFPFYVFSTTLFFLRIVRFYRLHEATSNITDFLCQKILLPIFGFSKGQLNAIFQMILLILCIFTLLHFFGCFWVYIGDFDDNWIEKKKSLIHDSSDNWELYVIGLYWACTIFSTVGYGDILGSSSIEFVYTMLVYLTGVVLFAFFLGNMNQMIIQMNAEAAMKKKLEEDLEDWLLKLIRIDNNKEFKNSQSDFITSYMDSYYRSNIGNSINDYPFYTQLTPKLRTKLLGNYLCKNIGSIFPIFFENLGSEFSAKIVTRMKYNKYEKWSVNNMSIKLIKAGKVPNYIYFVKSGYLSINSVDNLLFYSNLSPGEVFGDEYILFNTPSSYNLEYNPNSKHIPEEESDYVEFFIVSAGDFINTLAEYPIDFEILRKNSITKRRDNREIKQHAIQEFEETAKGATTPRNTCLSDGDKVLCVKEKKFVVTSFKKKQSCYID